MRLDERSRATYVTDMFYYPSINKFCLTLTASITGAALSAAVHTWDGDDATNPSYFGDNDNWVEGSAPNFGSYPVFPAGPSQMTVEMVNAGGASLFRSGTQGINFQTAGYVIQDTIGDGTGGFRYDFNGTAAATGGQPYGVNSSGIGINEIAARFQISSTDAKEPDSGQPSRPITIGAGNTLLFSGGWEDGQGWTLQGDGRMVVNNTNVGANRSNSFNAGINMNGNTTLLNRGSMQLGVSNRSLANGTIGGDGIFYARTGTTIDFLGTTLAPGGDGTAVGGPEAGSLTWTTGAVDTSSNLLIGAASTFEAYIGSGGTSDLAQLLIDLDGGTMTIDSSATLNIVGSVIQDGTYVIINDIGDSNPISGTFGTVLFNGVAANPSNFTVNYNDDFISVDVTGVVPEPSTYALIAGLACGALMVLRRRRR